MNTESYEQEKQKIIQQRDRNRDIFNCAVFWIEILQQGGSLIPYFETRGCRSIAIYGAGELGRLLAFELEQKSNIIVAGFIDKLAKTERTRWGLPVFLPEEYRTLSDIDMTVVTAVSFFDSIESMLLGMDISIPVVSLRDILEDRRNEAWYDRQGAF